MAVQLIFEPYFRKSIYLRVLLQHLIPQIIKKREGNTESGVAILFTTFMVLKITTISHKLKVLITLIMDGGILARVFINL